MTTDAAIARNDWLLEFEQLMDGRAIDWALAIFLFNSGLTPEAAAEVAKCTASC